MTRRRRRRCWSLKRRTRTRTRIVGNNNPVNRMFLSGLSPKGNVNGWRREMVEVDIDE